MDPELYRERYLEPFAGEYEVAAVPAEEDLFYLPDHLFYSEHRLRLPVFTYNLSLDRLTRTELLALLLEAGCGEPRHDTPGSVLNRIREVNDTNEARRTLLIERETELASLRQDLDSLMGSRSYRGYRMLMAPLRAVRGLVRKVRRGGVGHP